MYVINDRQFAALGAQWQFGSTLRYAVAPARHTHLKTWLHCHAVGLVAASLAYEVLGKLGNACVRLLLVVYAGRRM
jgi:hypothetical protein